MESASLNRHQFALQGLSSNGKYSLDKTASALHQLKVGIWMYFILLIFEGGLRKWVLPGLSTPLLLVRDPIALWLVIKAWTMGVLKPNSYLTITVVVIVAGIFTAMIFGHGNLLVALYGARIFLIHFPLVFIVGRVFTHEDVVKMGKAAIWISIPMTVLVALQFYSPQSAWVNRGVGGDMEGAGFNGGALGYYRPPGTFSFTNGNVLFYSFITPFLFYFWVTPKSINRILLLTATVCLFAAIPLSISRSLFFQAVISLFFLAVGTARKPKFMGKLIGAVIVGVIAFIILSQATFFKTILEVFSVRYEGANESEGGLQGVFLGRYLGSVIDVIKPTLPFFGYGLGLGTSVGATILNGKSGLGISEDEWGRLFGELGLFMGGTIIFVRLKLYVKLLSAAYKRLAGGDLLAWMLASFAMPNTPLGQWAQPAGLGFGVLITALMLASLRNAKQVGQNKLLA